MRPMADSGIPAIGHSQPAGGREWPIRRTHGRWSMAGGDPDRIGQVPSSATP